jgi:homospermidine synthase
VVVCSSFFFFFVFCCFFPFFSKAAIYLNRPGALTNVRTWTPFSGSFHGMLITHTEAISIADYFSLADASGKVTYRPTVHFAYHACDNAWMSMHQVAGREWVRHPEERLMVDEIAEGRDELGVLLMGHKKGAYWFGSDLTIHKTRELVHFNNATSLQVCTGVLTGVVYAYENPRKGQQTHTNTHAQQLCFLSSLLLPCACVIGCS